MIALLRRLVPPSVFHTYHFFLARLAAFVYRYPSEELVIIGVTGTNGKTTTSYLVAKALEASGEKVGCTTTALLKIGDKEWLNTTKMTRRGTLQMVPCRRAASFCKLLMATEGETGGLWMVDCVPFGMCSLESFRVIVHSVL